MAAAGWPVSGVRNSYLLEVRMEEMAEKEVIFILLLTVIWKI